MGISEIECRVMALVLAKQMGAGLFLDGLFFLSPGES